MKCPICNIGNLKQLDPNASTLSCDQGEHSIEPTEEQRREYGEQFAKDFHARVNDHEERPRVAKELAALSRETDQYLRRWNSPFDFVTQGCGLDHLTASAIAVVFPIKYGAHSSWHLIALGMMLQEKKAKAN